MAQFKLGLPALWRNSKLIEVNVAQRTSPPLTPSTQRPVDTPLLPGIAVPIFRSYVLPEQLAGPA